MLPKVHNPSRVLYHRELGYIGMSFQALKLKKKKAYRVFSGSGKGGRKLGGMER
jgi:hypothetical protein